MIKVVLRRTKRISQGDIFKNIEFIEYLEYKKGLFEVSIITFPYVIILTQDCDLSQDFLYRSGEKENQDKILLSVIAAPLYNIEQVYLGQHLEELNLKMTPINKNRTAGSDLRNNLKPRYHYLEFPPSINLTNLVIDFKHYFTLNINYLLKIRKFNWICRVKELYREDISQRFASFLSRIGLPEIKKSLIKAK